MHPDHTTNPEIDSYSGFHDNHHRKSTGLAEYLRGRQVKKVYLCGLAADICVYYTALDSLGESFETFVVEDATQPLDPDDFAKAKKDIRECEGWIIRLSEL